jgi:hypothetical protein
LNPSEEDVTVGKSKLFTERGSLDERERDHSWLNRTNIVVICLRIRSKSCKQKVEGSCAPRPHLMSPPFISSS